MKNIYQMSFFKKSAVDSSTLQSIDLDDLVLGGFKPDFVSSMPRMGWQGMDDKKVRSPLFTGFFTGFFHFFYSTFLG